MLPEPSLASRLPLLGNPPWVPDIFEDENEGPTSYSETSSTSINPLVMRLVSSTAAESGTLGKGRFLSPDVLGGKPEDPQTWNRYAYALNNPLKYVDPNGEEAFSAHEIAQPINAAAASIRSFNATIGNDPIVGFAATAVAGVGAFLDIGTGSGEAIGSGASDAEIGRAVANDVLTAAGSYFVLRGLAGAALESASARTATTPYTRPTGATTAEQRAFVQGKPCVGCGRTAEKMVADHKTPLVKEHYRTGRVDTARMRELRSIQPQCPTCSARQGAALRRYSQLKKRALEEPHR